MISELDTVTLAIALITSEYPIIQVSSGHFHYLKLFSATCLESMLSLVPRATGSRAASWRRRP